MSPVRLFARVTLAALAGLVPLLALTLSAEAVEALYVPWLGYPASLLLTGITRHLPFCLAEWLEGATIVAVSGVVFGLGRAWWTGRISAEEGTRLGGWGLAAAVSTVGLAFYLSWGLHYGRPPAAERLGWTTAPLTTEDRAELTALAEELIEVTNAHYLELHGSTDAEVVSAIMEAAAIDAATDDGWARAARALRLPSRMEVPRGPAKPLLSSPIFTRLGISGFFFPFTGEANYNTMPPRWQLPQTIAHEKAHQRGIASEDEANFFGFVACIHSNEPFVRYAGWLFAQRQILRVLLQIDPESAGELLQTRHPGVQRDVNAAHAFWTGYDGAAMDLGQAMNDAYLKLNQVEGGALSYSRSALLIVAWSREREQERPL